MSNTVTWNDPDTQQGVTGSTNTAVSPVYLVDPATKKAISPAASTSATADTIATGNLTAAQATAGTPVAGGTVAIALGSGQAVVEAQLTGTFSGGTTIQFEGTDDTGVTTNWFATFGKDTTVANAPNISSVAGPGPYLVRIPSAGYQQIRVRASALNGGDNVAVRLIGSVAGTGFGSLATNDGTFAKETGGNLATLAGVVSSSKAAVKAASGDFADGSIATIGTQADAVVTSSASSGTLMAFLKNLATIAGAISSSVMQSNTKQVNGTTVSVNAGNGDAGTQRVVVASDQAAVQVKRSTVAVYSLASTATTSSSNSGDLTVGPYTEISIDITTTAQTGTSPTIQFFYKRKAADGLYYTLWQSAVLTVAANTLSTSIGAGMAYNQSLGATGQLTWTIGGSATPGYTFSANIQGK